MITTELLDYIKAATASGVSDAEVRSQLQQQGWEGSDIDEAMNQLKSSASPPSATQASEASVVQSKKISPTVLVGIIVGNIAALGLLTYAGVVVHDNLKKADSRDVQLEVETIEEIDIVVVETVETDSAEPQEVQPEPDSPMPLETEETIAPSLAPAPTPSVPPPAPIRLDSTTTQSPVHSQRQADEAVFGWNMEYCSPLVQETYFEFFGETVPYTRTIIGMIDGRCHYREDLPNDNEIFCRFTKEEQLAISEFQGIISKLDGNAIISYVSGMTQTTYSINGGPAQIEPFTTAKAGSSCEIKT